MNPTLEQMYVYSANTDVFDKISKRENKVPDLLDSRGRVTREGYSVYRFAKNVEIDETVKTLIFLSNSGNTRDAEKRIKDAAKRIKDNRNLLETFKRASDSPIAI